MSDKKEEVKPKLSKAELIARSKLPKEQKDAYLRALGKESSGGKVPFSVYAKVRGISDSFVKPMLAYPKAAGVTMASLEEWDKIFTEF